MTRRTLAGLVAFPLAVALYLAAVLLPVPYVIYSPGVTVDVLGQRDGKEIVQVSGHRVYRDDGQLRMTTVYVTRPQSDLSLVQAMGAWLDRDDAIVPYDSVYAPEESQEDSREQSAVEMVSSQEAAVATALRQLGYDLPAVVKVDGVSPDLPADGKLQVNDVILRVDGTAVTEPAQVATAVKAADDGPVTFVVRRGDRRLRVTLTPQATDDGPKVGIVPGPGFDFPFTVSVDIPDDIGGPSAGLMFSLAIYDTLTPGSLTGGRVIAGTGTVTDKGVVGPIGGIQQKIVASRDAGAALFLVPKDNCADALGSHHGSMRLVRVDTMAGALKSVQAWADDPAVSLPTCQDAS